MSSLIHAGLVDRQHEGTCPCCREQVEDFLTHYILDCEYFTIQRDTHLSDVIVEVRDELLNWLPIVADEAREKEVTMLHDRCQSAVNPPNGVARRRRNGVVAAQPQPQPQVVPQPEFQWVFPHNVRNRMELVVRDDNVVDDIDINDDANVDVDGDADPVPLEP